LRTRLECFIKSRGIKLVHLAAQASYSRGHLARARDGEPTSRRFQDAVTNGVHRVLGEPVARADLFEPEGVAIWTLLPAVQSGDRSRGRPRKSSLRQIATAGSLAAAVGGLTESDLDAWLARIRSNTGARSEASIRDLLDAAFQLLDRVPARAERLYAFAITLTESLPASPPLLVAALRGHAERGRANALRMLGQYRSAMDVLIDAEQHFVDARYCSFEIGEVRYSRAGILFKTEEWPKALEAAVQARRIFEEEHDTTRALHAQLIEGCILVERGDLEEGRAVFVRLRKPFETRKHRDALARVYMNLGSCDLKRRETVIARHWLHRATQLFRELGMPSELARARWCSAKIAIVEGNRARGVRELRNAMRDFERLSMPADAGFVGLDLLEVLTKDAATAKESQKLARSLVDLFVTAGANVSAARAIAYLRDAATAQVADAALVAYVRRYVRRLDIEPDSAFQPPTSGVEPA
jgi:tetratricopeptide (TPR) repeat protein